MEAGENRLKIIPEISEIVTPISIYQVHAVRLKIITKIIQKVEEKRAKIADFSLTSLKRSPNKNTPSRPPNVNDEIPRAISTTALEVFIKKKEEITRTDVHRMLNPIITLLFWDERSIFLANRSNSAEEDIEEIDAAIVERAAASKPAITNPDKPAGSTSIINFGNISSDLISSLP